MRPLAHAEVVDDEQGHAGQLGQIGLACVGERCLGEFFEEGVGFAVDDAVALLDRGAADGLGNVALARYASSCKDIATNAGRKRLLVRPRTPAVSSARSRTSTKATPKRPPARCRLWVRAARGAVTTACIGSMPR